MDESKRPRLRLIRGGSGSNDSGDHANPYGIPRPVHLLPPSRARRTTVSPNHPSRGVKPPEPIVPRESPYIEPDPTPPYGTVRPKIFNVIQGGKE